MRYLLLLPLVLGFSMPSIAQDTYNCGIPVEENISPDALPYCDMHQRRLAYREEAIKLEKQMKERAENFAAPRRAALEQYQRDIEALNQEERDPFADEDTETLEFDDESDENTLSLGE